MTTGHFALAAGAKAGTTRVPLWTLFLASYLLDVVFIALAAAGVESFAPLDATHRAYGQVAIHAYYSHSLVGACLIAVAAGLISRRFLGKRGAFLVASVVASHWLLDVVVHRPDMPILPGNAGGLPLLGLGLWNYPLASAAVEVLLVGFGVLLYLESTLGGAQSDAPGARRRNLRAAVAVAVVAALLAMLAAADFLALPTVVALMLMLLLIVVGGWLDWRSHPVSRSGAPSEAATR